MDKPGKPPRMRAMNAGTDEPLVISCPDEDPATLRARFQDWGYLYFRQYVPAHACRSLLQDLTAPLAAHVALDRASGLPQLVGQPFVETDALWDVLYPQLQALESFHAFFHDPHILRLMRTVAGAEVFVYPMKMARIATPGRIGYETPPHQDARSHAAGPTMAGIWVALHDVCAEDGRLKILPRSHTRGVRPVVPSQGVGNVQCEIYPDETTWHVSDVQQGDVIIFHSATVHAAQPNRSARTVRISVDTRFCDYGAPVCSFNLEPHHGWRIAGLDWPRIYRDWQQQALQYYWKDYPNLWQFGA